MKLRVAIVDDEPLAVRRLEILLSRTTGAECVGTAGNCEDGLALIYEQKPDVVLLDIKLRDGSGFDIVDALSEDIAPAIIFSTAFESFAKRAFDVRAVDFLLKPVEQSRLQAALDRSRETIAGQDSLSRVADLNAIVEALREELRERDSGQEDDERDAQFWVKNARGVLVSIRESDIDLVTIEEDYARIHVGADSYLMRGSIRSFETRFSSADFVRVHRGAIVRLNAICRIHKRVGRPSSVVLRDGREVRAGRVYLAALRARLAI